MNPKRPTPSHIIIKVAKFKDKERILKKIPSKKETASYLQGSYHRLSADFSTETLQARRGWQEVFKVMKSKERQPILLYPARISFKIKGKINGSPDQRKKETKGVHFQQTSIARDVKRTALRRRRNIERNVGINLINGNE